MSAYKRGGTFQVKHDNILIAKQAEFLNRELSTGSNTITIKKTITPNTPEETELDNVYQKTLISRIENRVKQSDWKKSSAHMKEWSILSDHVKYVTFDGSKTFKKLSIDQVNYRQDIDLYRELQDKKLVNTDVNVGGSPDRLKAEYLDVYEGIYGEIVSSDRFDKDTDLSTMYLGQVNMTQGMEVKAEENFRIISHDTECDILVNTGMRKSYMSKSYFMRCKSLHSLPKFTSTTTRIQVGNGQYIGVWFVIPVIMTIQNHRI